ncbi:SDR family oxidoreductase [Mameliella alba]|nr:SDR family oxidoreductase [Antarctobacter heliothermus]MBY6143400.1 SDR family oxidoreductase [Mameliella alba]MCA0952875.1 SDR family oxidoreductase [Mameliella alba]
MARILINAAGGGAGRVIAKAFLDAGDQVMACDIAPEGLDALRAEYPQLQTRVGDAADEKDVAAVFDQMMSAFGGIDVLVNNVGIAGPTALLEDISLEEWNASLAANLTSHFLFARAAVVPMKAQGSGLIVNISSGSAKVGLPRRTPYVVSKGAVLSLTQNLARELGPYGLRANAILPGAIRGERIERVIKAKAEALDIAPEAYERDMLKYISMRTMVDPEDIAAMVQFLASPQGARISGQMIGVDGNIEWEE